MKKKKRKYVKRQKPQHWTELMQLVREYAEAETADSWKGGGDPVDIPLIEAQLELARVRLEAHVTKMRRYYGEVDE